MGLISPGGGNLLHFLELVQVLSTYDGDLRDPLRWPQERPVPIRVAPGLSVFLSRRCRGLRTSVELVPEPEVYSPVLTWILGYFWSLPRGVSPRLEWGHAPGLSFRGVAGVSCSRRVDQGICVFPSRLSHEAFPQGCPTCHRGVSLSLARKSRQCRENRFPWNGLRHLGDSGNGGTTLEFLSPFLGRAPPLEMRRERREFFPEPAVKGSLLTR